MANVWNAMKKHQSERQQANLPPVDSPGQAPVNAPAQTPADSAAQVLDSTSAAPPTDLPSPQVAPIASKASWMEPKHNGYSGLLRAHHDRGGTITEEYRALRTSLLAQHPDQKFCYIVTSADPGEGKTVTTLNLALVMAERQDKTTVIIDCDMRKSRIGSLLNMTAPAGMADVLRGTAKLEEVIQPTVYPNLFVIPAGKIDPDDVGKLMGGIALDDIVRHVRSRFDYVLFDTPPINLVSDAGMIGRVVGEALLVVRMNKTRRESVDKAIRLLRAANVNPAGMVLTHRTFHIPNYLYRYS